MEKMIKSKKSKISKISVNEPIKKKSSPNFKIAIVCAFLASIIGGSLLLMVGYTQGGLSTVMGLSDTDKVFIPLGQSIGLIITTFTLSRIISKVNTRILFFVASIITLISISLIAFLDKIIPAVAVGHVNAGRLVYFEIFSMLFGTGIGLISPLVSTFLCAQYTGKKQATMLSAVNGAYLIGAGMIPLIFSSFVVKTSGQSFGDTRKFFFIAMGLAVALGIVGFFMNYKHTKQQSSSKIINSKSAQVDESIKLMNPLKWAIILMAMYMFAETVVNYQYVNQATKIHTPTNGVISTIDNLNIFRAFGLFLTVQGLWRAISGLYVMPKIKSSIFILSSLVLGAIGMIMIACGLLEHMWAVFVIAAILGIGIGNLWPAIYVYSTALDQKRVTFIGMSINIISMAMIPISQLIIIGINHIPSSIAYPFIFGLGAIVIAIIILFIYKNRFLRFRHQFEK